MDSPFKTINDTVASLGQDHPDLTPEQRNKVLESATRDLATSLLENASVMLDQERSAAEAFRDRNVARWRAPLDLLHLIWQVARETGEFHAKKGPATCDPVLFDTLNLLFTRGLLITSEILHLLEGGFADAALARWRPLHEVRIASLFLRRHGPRAATLYRAQLEIHTLRRMQTIQKHAAHLGGRSISETELARQRSRVDQVKARFPDVDFAGDWGWAADFLGKRPKDRISLFNLEQDVKRDHWRPWFEWACIHNHAGHRPSKALLGMSEATHPLHLIGASNSGLAPPLHMTGITLTEIFQAFLLADAPDAGRLVFSGVLDELVERLRIATLDESPISTSQA